MKCKMIVKAVVLVTIQKIPPVACCTARTVHIEFYNPYCSFLVF